MMSSRVYRASLALATVACAFAATADVLDRPTGIKIGQRMTLRPYVSLSAAYDSNVGGRSARANGDVMWSVSPGFALNYATPAGLMGGEPYKIMELKPYIGTQRATSSVLLFAMMHIFAHFWFWTTSILVYLLLALCGILPLGIGMGIILLLMLCFCAAGIYLFIRGYKNGMVVRLVRLLSHIPGLKRWARRFADDHQEDLQKIDHQISELQGQHQRSFYASFALEYIGRIMQSLEIYFMFLLFHVGDNCQLSTVNFQLSTFLLSFLILSFTSLFANLLFFLPLQLGGREGGFAMSVAQLGMTADIGLFISIICRVRELFFTALGLLLMKVGNSRQ